MLMKNGSLRSKSSLEGQSYGLNLSQVLACNLDGEEHIEFQFMPRCINLIYVFHVKSILGIKFIKGPEGSS